MHLPGLNTEKRLLKIVFCLVEKSFACCFYLKFFNMKKLKFLSGLLLLVAFILFAGSCTGKIEKKSEQEVIDLVKNDKVSEIMIVNDEYALVYLKEDPQNPRFKVPIESREKFYAQVEGLMGNHDFVLGHEFTSNLFSGFFPTILFLVFIFYIIGGLYSLITILKNDFKNPIDKIAWLLIVIFVPAIGIILFLIFGRKQIDYSKR